MRWMGTLTKFWAWLSTSLTVLLIVFLFGYVFEHGAGNISVEFLTSPQEAWYWDPRAASGLRLWEACTSPVPLW